MPSLLPKKSAAIQAVLTGGKEIEASSYEDGRVLRKKLNKVVLAYSGGLDTSVVVPWLRYAPFCYGQCMFTMVCCS